MSPVLCKNVHQKDQKVHTTLLDTHAGLRIPGIYMNGEMSGVLNN